MLRMISVFFLILLFNSPSAWGWWTQGHVLMTRIAIRALPETMPSFFRSGEKMIAHVVVDPDLFKNREIEPEIRYLRGIESPEHFINVERLEGRKMPDNRYEFVRLCRDSNLLENRVGLLPYAVAEWTERLAVVFAEYQKWPDNPYIQQKCLLYAGYLAHYAQDMCQPLHLTVHYNGRVLANGSVSQKGIHGKLDGIIGYLGFDSDKLARNLEVKPLKNLMLGVFSQLDAGFILVDRVYELGNRFPNYLEKPLGSFSELDIKNWMPTDQVIEFSKDRVLEGARFTSVLYLTAWNISEKVQFNGALEWLDRTKSDQ